MKSFNRFVHGMTALTFLMSVSPTAWSRVQAVVGAAPVAIAQAPGSYEFKQYDETALQSKVLDILEQRSKDDKAYVESSVQQLNGSMKDLIAEHIRGGLQKLSDESLASGNLITSETFFAAKRSFEAQVEVINAQINAISQLPSVMKGSATSLSVQGRLQEIQHRFNVDLSPVVQAYEEQASAIVNKINALEFKIQAKNGAIVDQRGLTLSPALTANQYTADELNEKRMQAARLRVMTTQERNILNQFDIFALRNLNTTIQSYGKAYRANLDEKGKESALKALEQIFFARSLMRAQYGVALGAPQMNYDLKTFNWDFLSSDNHLAFTWQMITTRESQTALHNIMATALATQEARTKAIFGNNTNLASRVTSAITFLKGQSALSGLNTIILKMLVADLEEEMKVGELGGRRELKALFRARYYGTKANEEYFKKLGQSLTGADKSAWGDSSGISADNIVGQWNMAKVALQSYSARLTQAQAILDSLAVIEAAGNSRVDQINDDLLN